MSELPFRKFALTETELKEKANRARKASQETAPHRGVRGREPLGAQGRQGSSGASPLGGWGREREKERSGSDVSLGNPWCLHRHPAGSQRPRHGTRGLAQASRKAWET